MTGAMALLIEFGSSSWRACSEAASVEDMCPITNRLQVSTGRILLHELFSLYAKMDVIQALVRGAPPLYHPLKPSCLRRLGLSEWRYPLRGPPNTLLGLHDALTHIMARLATFIAKD